MKEQNMIEIIKKVENMAGNDISGAIREIKGNNGVIRHALILSKAGCNASPSIYIDQYLQNLENKQTTIQEVATDIFRQYQENKPKNIKLNISKTDKSMIYDNVQYQLINADMNKDLLENIPHKLFLDLAIVYRVMLQSASGSFLINDKIMKEFEIDFNELDKVAKTNTDNAGFNIQNMRSVLLAMLPCDIEEETTEPMYVCTNNAKIYGASILLQTDFFKELANKLNDDLYIIPSSIHELIAVSASGFEKGYLVEMVEDVNNSCVAPNETLSFNIYKYCRATNTIEIS